MGCPFGACEGGIDKAVELGLHSNPVKFDGIKPGVVDLLPEAEEFDGVAVSEPVADQVVTGICVFVAGEPVRQT